MSSTLIDRPPPFNAIATRRFPSHDGDPAYPTPPVPAVPPLILIVDDHEDSRVIARVLLEHVGFRVAEAATGCEGLQVATARRPAVVLLDLLLPELDGWALARRLRADSRTCSAVVIAVTALAGTDDQDRALLAGCDEVLTKPVAPLLLLDAVRRYIGCVPPLIRRVGS